MFFWGLNHDVGDDSDELEDASNDEADLPDAKLILKVDCDRHVDATYLEGEHVGRRQVIVALEMVDKNGSEGKEEAKCPTDNAKQLVDIGVAVMRGTLTVADECGNTHQEAEEYQGHAGDGSCLAL